MVLLPIVERELRVAARRRATYWVRAGFAFGGIVIGFFVFLATYRSSAQSFSESLFSAIAFICLFFSLFAGVRYTADCLSEEKRDGTLGLLFLTDLSGYDVVLGKIAATSLSGFYCLLAVLPLLALPLLLGGITNGEMWRTAVVMINTFLFSLALGVLISSLSWSARKAMGLTILGILLVLLLLPAIGGLILLLSPSHKSKIAELTFWPCPVYALTCSDDWQYRKAPWPYWRSIAIVHALTWACLVSACLIIPRAWRDKSALTERERRRVRWPWLQAFLAGQRNKARSCLLDINAFLWLAGRSGAKSFTIWTILAILAGFWCWGWLRAGHDWLNEAIFFPTAIVLNSLLKLWVASAAGRRLGDDRKSGALELLLCTPLTVKDILRGQLLALARQFFWPLVFVLGVECVFLASSLQRESFHDNPMNPTVWFAAMIMLLADLSALAWVAMWTALTAKSPNRITGFTVVRILVVPWALYIGLIIILGSARDFKPWPKPEWPLHIGLWCGLSIVTDLFFGLLAWSQLRFRFRELALHRFPPLTSRLAGLFKRGPETARVRGAGES
jgi:ABC-type transport system involved in multi-copper enzyme maturation permease subunit